MAGPKTMELIHMILKTAGRNMRVRVWIFAGLMVLILFVGHSRVAFCGLCPASFSPAKSPAKRTESLQGTIWIRFATEALRLASQNRHGPHRKSENVRSNQSLFFVLRSFQEFATQESRIHRPHPDVADGN